MKSLTILLHGVIIFFLTLLLPSLSLPSDPVAPPFEGALITNTITVDVVGTFRENENFTHDQRVGEISITQQENCDEPTELYRSALDQAETRYTDEVRATNGHTTFVKDFSFTTHPEEGDPNIETERTIGFDAIAGSTDGTIKATEKGSIAIFHNIGIHTCIEQTEQDETRICIKANNECLGIAEGSAFFAHTLSARSETELTTTYTPSAHHVVDAIGNGTAEAEILFTHTRGPIIITDDCARIDCPGGEESYIVAYNETTETHGIFSSFHKDLSAGVVEQYQAPQTSFFSGLITLDALCPFSP